VFDHLAGVALGGSSMLEAFSLLGALAEATQTIELGSMVVNVWNREVGTLLTAAASITHLSGRQVHLGIGAGSSPGSAWAAEQRAVDARVEPRLSVRHDRVRHVLDLADAMWSSDRDERFATFPLPSPRPLTIVGVNSVALSRLAGARADGINVQWNRPGRDEFLDAADAAAGDRPFMRTAYLPYDRDLFDPTHPTRLAMSARRIDRLVLASFGSAPELPASV
jgi:alkanesulfonate monooxygenase SsuD/methylene tetrahydromethanopterin reductase-like flavin-dependent oxidoreductase (luciferase family)